jgi:hypothetical protein
LARGALRVLFASKTSTAFIANYLSFGTMSPIHQPYPPKEKHACALSVEIAELEARLRSAAERSARQAARTGKLTRASDRTAVDPALMRRDRPAGRLR